MPRARSKEMDPVGMTGILMAASRWPSFMTDALAVLLLDLGNGGFDGLAAGHVALFLLVVFHGFLRIGRISRGRSNSALFCLFYHIRRRE